MKVCFLNPPIWPYRKIMRNFDCATESKGNYLYQPYDFLLLSSRLPKDSTLKVLDCIANKTTVDEMLDSLNSFKPDIIVISFAQTSLDSDIDVISQIRESMPSTPIVGFGDLVFSSSPPLKLVNSLDALITDPLYFSFEETRNYSREDFKTKNFNSKWHQGFYKRTDLKAAGEVHIERPKHELFFHDSYQWPFSRHLKYTTVFTAWGCPYSCSYCVMSNFPNLYRPWIDVLDEIKYIVNELKVKEIYIGDRSFGLPRNNVVALLKAIIDEDIKFSWSTYFHPNQYDEELLDLMAKSGCHTIIVGIETATFESLKEFGRHVKKDRFQKLVDHARRLGISICGDFIIGLPNQTKEEILNTIDLSIDIDIDYASFNIAAPLPGSLIEKVALNKVDNLSGFDSSGNQEVLPSNILSSDELLKLRDLAVRKFYFRPNYLVKRMLNLKGIEHFFIQLLQGYQLFRRLFR